MIGSARPVRQMLEERDVGVPPSRQSFRRQLQAPVRIRHDGLEYSAGHGQDRLRERAQRVGAIERPRGFKDRLSGGLRRGGLRAVGTPRERRHGVDDLLRGRLAGEELPDRPVPRGEHLRVGAVVRAPPA